MGLGGLCWLRHGACSFRSVSVRRAAALMPESGRVKGDALAQLGQFHLFLQLLHGLGIHCVGIKQRRISFTGSSSPRQSIISPLAVPRPRATRCAAMGSAWKMRLMRPARPRSTMTITH